MLAPTLSSRLVCSAVVATALGCAGEPFLYEPSADDAIDGSIPQGDDDDGGGGASDSPQKRPANDDTCDTQANPCPTGICEDTTCRMPRSCAEPSAQRPNVASGMVWIDVDGADPTPPIEIYCDLSTAGGGFALAMRVELGAPCSFAAEATSQLPQDETATCAKLSDELINLLSPNRLFYSVVGESQPLFTRYDGIISSDAGPHRVASNLSFEALDRPNHDVTYQYWKLFHQHDFYDADGCAGAAPETVRLAMEYASNGYVYAVTGDCATLGTNVTSLRADVFIR